MGELWIFKPDIYDKDKFKFYITQYDPDTESNWKTMTYTHLCNNTTVEDYTTEIFINISTNFRNYTWEANKWIYLVAEYDNNVINVVEYVFMDDSKVIDIIEPFNIVGSVVEPTPYN